MEGLAIDGNRLLLGLHFCGDDLHILATNRVEAICSVPPTLSGSKPSWLVLYDAPGADHKEGEQTVFGDLLRHK